MDMRRFASGILIAVIALGTLTQDLLSDTRAFSAEPEEKNTAQKNSMRDQISSLPQGTLLEVRLTDGRKLSGRLAELTQETFILQPVRTTNAARTVVDFNQVRSFKKLKDQPKGVSTRNWSVLLAVVGFVAGVLTYVAIHRRHL